MGSTLYAIYESDDYPFYFVTLITDKNPSKEVTKRSNEFNVYAIPVAFFDGGYRVFVGGTTNQKYYRPLIEESGQRDVHKLEVTLSFQWNPELVFPPYLRIDEPRNGIYLFNEYKKEYQKPLIIGAFNIEVTAFDNESGIDHVDFYINDELRSTDSFSPYSMNNWQEKKLFGHYTIKVIAYDEFGYQSSEEIDVIKIF